MTRTKKWLALVLAICLIATIPAALAGEAKPVVRVVVPGISEQSTTDPISGITTLGLKDFEDFLNSKIQSATIKLISIPWDGWIQKIEAMVNAGEMDVGFFTNQVAVPDWYADLTPYLTSDAQVNFGTLSNYYIDPAVYYPTYNSFNYPEATGKVFGLPMTIACNYFVIDKLLFEQWGVELPQDGVTFDDLVAISEKMTGANPVTGEQNYGAYLRSYWLEWFAVSYDAVKSVQSDTMLLSDLDKAAYVDYIKESPEVLNYFNAISRLVNCAPEGIATDTGDEKFFTEENDIAINFDVNRVSSLYTKYMYADQSEILDRFLPVLVPTGSNGQQGFPEFFRFAITKSAKDPDVAWEVVKELTTNSEIVDFYLTNYATDKISVLQDVSNVPMMHYAFNQQRHEYQMKSVFKTNDYWTWRVPLQDVNKLMVSKQITPEEARQQFHQGVNNWVENTKAQLGQ